MRALCTCQWGSARIFVVNGQTWTACEHRTLPYAAASHAWYIRPRDDLPGCAPIERDRQLNQTRQIIGTALICCNECNTLISTSLWTAYFWVHPKSPAAYPKLQSFHRQVVVTLLYKLWEIATLNTLTRFTACADDGFQEAHTLSRAHRVGHCHAEVREVGQHIVMHGSILCWQAAVITSCRGHRC